MSPAEWSRREFLRIVAVLGVATACGVTVQAAQGRPVFATWGQESLTLNGLEQPFASLPGHGFGSLCGRGR